MPQIVPLYRRHGYAFVFPNILNVFMSLLHRDGAKYYSNISDQKNQDNPGDHCKHSDRLENKFRNQGFEVELQLNITPGVVENVHDGPWLTDSASVGEGGSPAFQILNHRQFCQLLSEIRLLMFPLGHWLGLEFLKVGCL